MTVSESERRHLILEAASRLVRHYGPGKTTVADIAREAAIGVGTVYLEFRNKDAILVALSQSRHQRVLHAVELAWGDGRPAPERLERALVARVQAFLGCDDGPHGPELLTCACPAVAEAYRAFRESERQLFARFLRDAAARGDLDVRDANEAARLLLLAHRAFEPPHLFELAAERRAETVGRDVARMCRLLLAGLVPRTPPRRARR
jgi:AcrR family transcriptional regulator